MKKIITTAICIMFALTTNAFGANWKIDTDHSAANFAIQHMAISKVKGTFDKVSGNLEFHESGPTPFTLQIVIDPASIDTGVEKRDAHLKSADFFDVKKFSSIYFTSEKVSPTGDSTYEVEGKLTMHGISKNIKITLNGLLQEVKDPWGNIRKGAQVTAEINRKDFGIVYNAVLESGNLLIGETAKIDVDLEFIKN